MPETKQTSSMSSDSFIMPPVKHTGRNIFLVVLGIVILGGGLGGSVWYWQQQKLKSQEQSYQTQVAQLNTELQQVQKQIDDLTRTPSVQASATLKSLYDLWLSGSQNSTDKATLITQSLEKKLITTELAAMIKQNKTNVLCAIQKPESYTYVITSAGDQKTVASVTVKSAQSSQTSTDNLINEGGTWKVSAISCLVQ